MGGDKTAAAPKASKANKTPKVNKVPGTPIDSGPGPLLGVQPSLAAVGAEQVSKWITELIQEIQISRALGYELAGVKFSNESATQWLGIETGYLQKCLVVADMRVS